MIPHVAPPVWPDSPSARKGRFASAIYCNATELVEDREARSAVQEKCRVALLGIPDDEGVRLNHGRVGAAKGPHALRGALARYGVATPMESVGSGPPYPHVFDAGDVIIGRDIHETHDRVTEATLAILELGMFPIAVGGGHDLTYPFVRAVSRCHGPLAGVYFDAHLDVRAEVGSGMPFRALLEGGHASRLSVTGLNLLANSREHSEWFATHGGSWEPIDASRWPEGRGWEKQFVSFDMDVLDSSSAPGVSAPNPAGMTAREAESYMFAAGRSPAVKCFDIMELNPAHDVDGRTARLGAHLLLKFLRGFAERGQ